MTKRTIFHPGFFVLFLIVFLVLIGFGSNLADRVLGPDEDKIHQQCVARVHAEKEACLNGGPLNGIFKTSRRIKTCDEIYQRELKNCD